MGKTLAHSTLFGGPFLPWRCFSARDASTAVCPWSALSETDTLLSESSFLLTLNLHYSREIIL